MQPLRIDDGARNGTGQPQGDDSRGCGRSSNGTEQLQLHIVRSVVWVSLLRFFVRLLVWSRWLARCGSLGTTEPSADWRAAARRRLRAVALLEVNSSDVVIVDILMMVIVIKLAAGRSTVGGRSSPSKRLQCSHNCTDPFFHMLYGERGWRAAAIP